VRPEPWCCFAREERSVLLLFGAQQQIVRRAV